LRLFISLMVLLALIIPSTSQAITFYFGSAKVIKEVRRRRQHGTWYLYPERHKRYHLARDEAYWIDPNDHELGYLYPYNCGPTSYCPFYHHVAPEIRPPVKMPKFPLGRYFILPDVRDEKDYYRLFNNSEYDFNW